MLDLEVLLKVTCCVCGSGMSLTLRCEGDGVAQGHSAQVNIPCPACYQVNQVIFTPATGEFVEVRRESWRLHLPVPSLN